MRWVVAVVLPSTGLFGQLIVDSTRADQMEKYFERQKTDRVLRCEVNPVRPQLNFGLNFQTGYVFRVPLNQYVGPGHVWAIASRVTPDSGAGPVYLSSAVRIPNLPKTNVVAEWGGAYLVGEGGYTVDWLLIDDSNRFCRKTWHIEAKRGPGERGLNLGMEPNTVRQFSFRRWTAQSDKTPDVRTLGRLTVLLHAAPLFPNSTRLRARDRIMLLGSLASLLESLPARSVRVVVFNLDQQKELLRQDNFTPDVFDSVAQSMNGIELQLVSYRVLTNQRGHVDLLADLVNQELRNRQPAEAVIFLGPGTRYSDKVPESVLEEHSSGPPFFYLKYKPYLSMPVLANPDILGGNPNFRSRRASDFPDSIELALKKLHGKTIGVHTPEEFAKAIKQVEAQISGEK